MAGGADAAKLGHDVVMSPTSHCYFDYGQSTSPSEPECIGGVIALGTVYGFDPIPPTLEPAQHFRILGVQGNLWTEYLGTPREVEYFAFPRACALAEVGWSPPQRRDYDDFLQRLRAHLARLDQARVNYRMLD
jgi:hexosaminidase